MALAPGLLARYAGLYHGVSTDLVRRVFVRGDSLFYSRGPRNETHLAPLAPGRFLLSAAPARIEVEFAAAPGRARPEMWVRTAGSQPRRYVPVDPARGPWTASSTGAWRDWGPASSASPFRRGSTTASGRAG